MMMGFGSYGSGGGCSSSSSNLSALAPPFTVDRSVSKPLVDLTEPPLNWLNTHSLSFDSFHSPNSYVYPFNSPPQPPSAAHMPPPDNSVPFTSTDSLLYGQNADAMLTSNLVEAKPYYPSYVSSTKYSYEDYAQSLSGLWDVARGWDYGKNVELGDSFSSKGMNATDLSIYKDYTDQGAHSSKGLSACDQNSTSIDMLGSEMHLGSANREQLDYTSFQGQISEFMPVEYSRKSVLGSTSLFSETYSVASSCEQGLSRNHQTPYDAYEKGVKQHGIIPNDMSSVMKSSPGLVIRSQAVGSSPSAPIANSFNNVENGSCASKTDFSGIDNCSSTKDFHPLQSSGCKVHFDSSQVNFHLEGDNHSFPDLPSEKKEKLLRNVTNDPFRAKSGLQIPDTGPVGFNLTLGDAAINHVEGSSESLDYNPAVDSPCWKGAPIYHFSPLETSGPVFAQLAKKIEVCKGSDLTGSTNNASKSSPEKPSESSLYHENGCPENKSSSSPKRPYLTNLLIQEHGFDHAAKAGSDYMMSSCGLGIWFSDYIDKPKKDYVLANNSVDEFNFKPFQSIQQNPVEDKLTSKKKSKSGTGVADVGMSTNNATESCSSHVPLHATEHVLGSPSSMEAAPVKLNKLHVEESAPQMCVQTLISTIQNLSELLLFHCSNQVELKENDLDALKGVVNNLGKCISKTLGPEAPPEESPPPIKFTQFPKELPDIDEGVPAIQPQAKKAAVSSFNQSDYHHDQEGRIQYIMSAKKCSKCSDFTSQRGDPERIKDDNMTQAIKKVLSENFVDKEDAQTQMHLYKNLWLEAEAALCSINYKARFDRMKIELEKCKLHVKDLLANTPELEKLLQSTFSADLNTASTLPPPVKNDSAKDVSVPDFPIINASSQPDDVMARFHFLKLQEYNANHMSTTDVEKLSSSNFSSTMNMVDKMAAEAKNDETPHILKSSLPNSISTSHADDVEASVMARFHILKSRIENSGCADVDGQQLLQVADFGFAGEGKHCPEEGILDINMEPVVQHNNDNHPLDKLTVKEFHLHVKDDTVFESHWWTNRLGNQLPASCYDSSSSDWEHVLKEDLPGHNP